MWSICKNTEEMRDSEGETDGNGREKEWTETAKPNDKRVWADERSSEWSR